MKPHIEFSPLTGPSLEEYKSILEQLGQEPEFQERRLYVINHNTKQAFLSNTWTLDCNILKSGWTWSVLANTYGLLAKGYNILNREEKISSKMERDFLKH